MKSGYQGYRRRSRLPGMLMILVIILVVGGGAYWGWSYFTNSRDNSSSEVAEKPAKDIVPPKAEEFLASGAVGDSQYWISIDKSEFILTLYQGKEIVKKYPIAVGLISGDKEEPGDSRTPEGVFAVKGIENSIHWVYDFGDGKGATEGAFGPWFIRLETGWDGIGIHGTHDPESLGTRCTAGCIRMKNEDLLEIVSKIDAGTKVLIED